MLTLQTETEKPAVQRSAPIGFFWRSCVMRGPTTSLSLTTAALALAALAVTGCKERKREPVPGPQSHPQVWQQALPAASEIPLQQAGDGRHVQSAHKGGQPTGVSGISWFQGTIEEAFSRSCTG